MITLKLQKAIGHFEPSTIFIADIDTITVRVPKAKGKTVLTVNGKTYCADDGVVKIPRADLDSNIIVCEYQVYDNGKMTACTPCENLLCVPLKANGEWQSEKEFYQTFIKDLAQRLAKLEAICADVETSTNKRVSALEKGKFTLCKFKEEKQ